MTVSPVLLERRIFPIAKISRSVRQSHQVTVSPVLLERRILPIAKISKSVRLLNGREGQERRGLDEFLAGEHILSTCLCAQPNSASNFNRLFVLHNRTFRAGRTDGHTYSPIG